MTNVTLVSVALVFKLCGTLSFIFLMKNLFESSGSHSWNRLRLGSPRHSCQDGVPVTVSYHWSVLHNVGHPYKIWSPFGGEVGYILLGRLYNSRHKINIKAMMHLSLTDQFFRVVSITRLMAKRKIKDKEVPRVTVHYYQCSIWEEGVSCEWHPQPSFMDGVVSLWSELLYLDIIFEVILCPGSSLWRWVRGSRLLINMSSPDG